MRHRFFSLLFVALCGLAPAALGSLLHWSPWLWGFMCMVTASGSLLLVMTVLSSGRTPAVAYDPAPPEPPAAPVEQPYQETRVIDAALPSAVDGYDFLFSATVWWRPVPDPSGWSDGASPALAVSAVISRAMEVVHREEPGRANFARYVLEGELSVPLQDLSGRVEARTADVTLALAPADRDRLQKLRDLRKDEEVWEYERQHERNKRRYLGDDVLRSTGSAVVWWLARHEDEIEKAVDMIGPLAQITAAANDEEVPELFRHLLVPPVDARTEATVGGPLWSDPGQGGAAFDREREVGVPERLLLLLEAVGLKPDMDEYTVLVHRVVRSLEAAGLHEAAEEIRRTVLPAPAPDDEEDPDDTSPDDPSNGPTNGDDGTPGPWFRPYPGPGGAPFTEGATPPPPDTDTFVPGPPPSDTDVRPENRQHPSDTTATSPYFWDTTQTPHRPTAPQPQDEYGENGENGELIR
ncbi:hypothetical protein CF54_02770 [Streptomyces sp. Tu 6176]|uniref:hypothetical protein n=1 Tax=Streptomyces sp. Tu 6176 TaxID=1470557 RepID=UPI00044A39A6|nr:hypothetical protein [Streptomyces sp. Tu 6176]EYT84213.1 hypothetical protein CF54_02770 [Streptomyces sp. Tu 6176]